MHHRRPSVSSIWALHHRYGRPRSGDKQIFASYQNTTIYFYRDAVVQMNEKKRTMPNIKTNNISFNIYRSLVLLLIQKVLANRRWFESSQIERVFLCFSSIFVLIGSPIKLWKKLIGNKKSTWWRYKDWCLTIVPLTFSHFIISLVYTLIKWNSEINEILNTVEAIMNKITIAVSPTDLPLLELDSNFRVVRKRQKELS